MKTIVVMNWSTLIGTILFWVFLAAFLGSCHLVSIEELSVKKSCIEKSGSWSASDRACLFSGGKNGS